MVRRVGLLLFDGFVQKVDCSVVGGRRGITTVVVLPKSLKWVAGGWREG